MPYMSEVVVAICRVKELAMTNVGSKMNENTDVMSWDLFVPRKSVRKKYSVDALSISV